MNKYNLHEQNLFLLNEADKFKIHELKNIEDLIEDTFFSAETDKFTFCSTSYYCLKSLEFFKSEQI